MSASRLGLAGPVLAAPAPLEAAVRARLERLAADDFAARLHRRDTSLWGDDPARRAVAARRLGWLSAPELMRPRTNALRDFAAEVQAEGFTHVVLLGMGGSSLAPEVLARSGGATGAGLQLSVLDNTSPAAVDAVLGAHDPARTLFVVSSKSGGTIEVTCFERCAFEWANPAGGRGRAFVAITDPATALERLARERGYRTVFTNPPDIGGRYSALSLFGLVPAALLGLDLDPLLDGALAEAEACGPEAETDANPGLIVGATLGEMALAGRDKLTLILPPELASLGDWIEQLLAESTGKDGKGVVPVTGEPLGAPESYGNDRVFVSITLGDRAPGAEPALEALRAAGQPVLSWSRPALHALGAEFLRWEVATAVAGAVLGVDPFDEPDVTEAKLATQSLLERHRAEGALPSVEPVARTGALEAAAPPAVVQRLRNRVAGGANDVMEWFTAWRSMVVPGDYVGVLAFLHPTPERRAKLEAIRRGLSRTTRAAVTLGYGPRFLHSTGQLHKGGSDRGVFLQLVGSEGDRTIPGETFGFQTLQRAQALGDYQVLERRGRRVLRLDLGAEIDANLQRLAEAL